MSNTVECVKFSAQVGGSEIILETGRLANQADGAVWIQCGGTVVLVTCVTQSLRNEQDFFPLTVDYQEKMYAAGRIPGSFFRREIGRPSERETLCSRLIDRPIRPLFPKGFADEVQILATVLSADQENDPDVLALTGASAALLISPIPFLGPIAGARVGYIDNEFVLNPKSQDMERSQLNLVLAVSRHGVVMVEGSSLFAPEELVGQALDWGFKAIQPLLGLQEELAARTGKAKMKFISPESCTELTEKIKSLAEAELVQAMRIPDKVERKAARKKLAEKVALAVAEDPQFSELPQAQRKAADILMSLGKDLLRARIRDEGLRIDGRDLKTVRPISIETGLLPRTHGSTLFARGETKVLVVATLGSGGDEQKMETIMGEEGKRFMLHYNFPPYSVGEVKPVRVSRREIGHGALAERALTPVLPSTEEFPYTLRIVSETMESNGSSSMATVCGASLAFMDAGVPIKDAVAGIAMGLIKEEDRFYVLTDILGEEDALGDMDFKIAGTKDGVTAVQMDIKVTGIPAEIMAKALAQAREARLHILGEMNKILDKPRPTLSKYAPQLEVVEVNPDIIRMIIGPGGKNIKAITSTTGASVDIEDSGKVHIFAPSIEALEKAKSMILYYDQKPEVGKNYNAKVKKVLEIGVVVEVLPSVEALVHISQLDTKRVEKASDFAKPGDDMLVKVIEVSPEGRVRASRAAVILEEQGEAWDPSKTQRPPRREGGREGGRPERKGRDRN